VLSTIVTQKNTIIPTSTVAPGVYFLELFEHGSTVPYKIQKVVKLND